MEYINALLPALEHFRMLGYWAVLLVSLLESLAFVGVVVPGSVFVVLAGSLATRGYFDIGDLVWFASAGAILGERQQPLSMIIVASGEETLADAFTRAGWVATDPLRIDTMAKMLVALISNTGYPAAPVAPSFWNGSVNDLSFSKTSPARTVRERHQARLWKTDLRTPDGRSIYVGTTIFDAGLKWQVVYRIGPDVDAEREELVRDLLAAGVVASAEWNGFISPMTGKNTFGDPYFTTGNIATIHLK
ncbi:MAG: LssY C-terminal domain-containing protein [Deltaproteobacteria bacterium]|nr:LssY C-terminal domain-containing protein [Deltaproteobacteria bacterium]